MNVWEYSRALDAAFLACENLDAEINNYVKDLTRNKAWMIVEYKTGRGTIGSRSLRKGEMDAGAYIDSVFGQITEREDYSWPRGAVRG